MRQDDSSTSVPVRARPNPRRAAAAARLAGDADSQEAVAERMRRAAKRSAAVGSSTRPKSGRPDPGPTAGSAALALAPQRRADPRRIEEERPRHLRVVGERRLSAPARRRRARAVLIASIASATVIALSLVYFNVVLAQRQFAIDRLDTELTQAQSTYQEQRLEVAELSSPQHVISEAEGKLGMVQPSSVQYLIAPVGGSVLPANSTSAPLGDTNSPSTSPPTQAPAGEADWPVIKSELAGQP